MKKQLRTLLILIVSVQVHALAQAQPQTQAQAQAPTQTQGHLSQSAPSPVPAEVFAGNRRVAIQVLFDKKFSPQSRFSFFNVSMNTANYSNKASENEFTSVSSIKFELLKGLAVTAGANINSQNGLQPSTGFQYIFAGKNILAIVSPVIYFRPTTNFETFFLFQYRPALSKQLKLHTRLQVLYNYNLQVYAHDRSYLYARAGLGYRNFSFGFGANLDRYGPAKYLKENYGGFLQVEFF